MKNILNLSGYKVVNVTEGESDYRIQAGVIMGPKNCPYCNDSGFVGFGRRDEVIMDVPIRNKPTSIILNRRRYRCRSCRRTFLDAAPHKDDRRQMTNRLVQYIESESLQRPFTSVAADVGVDDKTVRNIFSDYCERLEQTLMFEMPEWLGVIDIDIINARCMIVDVKQKTVLDILESSEKDTIRRFLKKCADREKVRYVLMGLWNPYRQVVKVMMPSAKIIIDKSYIFKLANESMDRARRAVSNTLTLRQRRRLAPDKYLLLKSRHDLTKAELIKLSKLELDFPEISCVYALKESFLRIWDCENKYDAQVKFYAWLPGVTPSMKVYFNPLIKVVDDWNEEIFTYFDQPLASAYTKTLNNLVSVVNCADRGSSFEALRTKVLFTELLRNGERNNFSSIAKK